MSSLFLHSPAQPCSVVEQIADCVKDLGRLAGLGCLVETPDSQLVAHHVTRTSAALVDALVTGQLAALHRALSERRTIGLLPTGPVIEGVLGDRRAVYVPLRNLDRAVGGLWLLLADAPPSLELLRLPAERLTELLSCTTAGMAAHAACLDGGAVPAELSGGEIFWVARVMAEVDAETLVRSLSSVSGTLTLLPIRSGQQVYVVAAGPCRVRSERALQAFQALCSAATTRLGIPVTMGVSTSCGSVVPARGQADLAASVAPTGLCSTLADVRSTVVVRHLARALHTLPELGADPLDALVEYDTRRQASLIETVSAWLDECCDVGRTITRLGIHSNTLRYRLRRVEEIAGLNIRENARERLELQLRLLNVELGS